MSSQPSLDADAPSDAELITSVREGDLDAYGELFGRHRDAATMLARLLTSAGDADDLVSDAFSSVLRTLRGGGGPDIAFRAYLLTAVRRRHIDVLRARKRVEATDDVDKLDAGEPFRDAAVDAFESSAAAHAFRSLPERWQMVLWQLEVEGQKPAEVAVLLGTSPNSVSALAYRAREGLKQAYVQNHLADTADDECRWVTERLGAYIRNGLAKRESAKVGEHLDDCDRCSALYLELVDVNSNLRGLIASIVLGGTAAAYLTSLSTTGAATGLPAAWLSRLRDVVKANAAVSAGAAAAAIVVIAAGAFALTHDRRDPGRVASDPAGLTQQAPSDSNTAPSAAPVGPDPGTRKPRQTDSLAAVPNQSPFGPVLPFAPTSSGPAVMAAVRTTSPSSPVETTHGPTSPAPITATPTTNPPAPLPQVDVDLVESHKFVLAMSGDQYLLRSTVHVTASKPVAGLTVSVSSSTGKLNGNGENGTWTCSKPQPAAELTCTATTKYPGKLWIWMFQPHASPHFQYSMDASAPGTDDPDVANNHYEFDGPATP